MISNKWTYSEGEINSLFVEAEQAPAPAAEQPPVTSAPPEGGDTEGQVGQDTESPETESDEDSMTANDVDLSKFDEPEELGKLAKNIIDAINNNDDLDDEEKETMLNKIVKAAGGK